MLEKAFSIVLLMLGFVLVSFLSHRLDDWWSKRRKKKESKPQVLETGLVRVTEEMLYPIQQLATFEFPDALNKFIKNHTARELASLTLQHITEERRIEAEEDEFVRARRTEMLVDIQRAITIAAALFKKDIPQRLMVLDNRTRELYGCWSLHNLPFPVMVDWFEVDHGFSVGNSDSLTQLTLAKYTARTLIVASVVMHFLQQGGYPSFEVFADSLRLNLKRKQRKDIEEGVFTDEEIKMMVTAYAAVASLSIPLSYMLHNATTCALVHRMTHKPAVPPVAAKIEVPNTVVEKK